jgi:aspartyl protease family protein
MLKNIVALMVVTVGSVYGVQSYLDFKENTLEKRNAEKTAATQQQVQQASKVTQQAPQPVYGRKTRLKMDSRGHFVTNAKMNNRSVQVLVDTGATSVAINKKTARRLGISLKASDFKYNVNTANGTTKAAMAMIDKIQIGNVTVRNVQTAVLDDNALTSTLLGMSFLGQLRSFEVKNRELLLVQ